MDSTQQRTSISVNDTSLRPETDFMELVWENGQMMMKGQSRMAPISENFVTLAPKINNTRNSNVSKMAKFSMVDSISADFELHVPSCDLGLDDEADDIVPWLNYPSMEDSLPNEYNTSDFLRDLSGITMNDHSTDNHLASRDNRISFQGNSSSLKHGNTSKTPLSTEKHATSLSNVTRNYDGTHKPSSLCAFTSLRLQKLDAGQPSNTTTTKASSGFTNFPCISRHDNIRGTKEMVSRNNQSAVAQLFNANSESFPATPTEEVPSSKDKLREDVVKNDALQNPTDCVGKPEMGCQKNKEKPIVVTASSVCSGNSVERASNELRRDLKRKSRDTRESEDPSEEVEEESVGGARKGHRGRGGSKRTRAAEVHNLSERRRRDRIIEKMRSLQELIPNCNKVDKASMLDEAIEYLKTLQLQVQMLAMGSGLYMPSMIQGGHMPHFSPIGLGMGLGFNMIPFQGPHYPLHNMGPAFPGMPGSIFQAFGQGFPMPMQQLPVLPASGVPSLNMPNVLGVQGTVNPAASNHASNANASSET